MNEIITTPDKILKELDLIQDIYDVQFSKINPNSWIHGVFNENQNQIDGRLMIGINICSEIKLFDIQSYKEELTHRHESARDTTLLKNQLYRIRERAIQVRNFYNQNFTADCEIVANFLNQSDVLENDVNAHYDFVKSHKALIVVNDDFYISCVYYGCELAHLDSGIVPCSERFEFGHLGDNHLLVDVCRSLICFVDDIYPPGGTDKKVNESQKVNINYQNGNIATLPKELNAEKAERLNVLSGNQLNTLFAELKGCFEPYNKEYFIYAFDGGDKPVGYNRLPKTKKLTDAQFVYLISEFFTNGVTNWHAAKELSIKNPEQKKSNYINNSTRKPQGHEIIDVIIQKVKNV